MDERDGLRRMFSHPGNFKLYEIENSSAGNQSVKDLFDPKIRRGNQLLKATLIVTQKEDSLVRFQIV